MIASGCYTIRLLVGCERRGWLQPAVANVIVDVYSLGVTASPSGICVSRLEKRRA
jgi:hypothetical protein